MLRKKTIISGILFCCVFTVKLGFSQCNSHLNGIDSIGGPSNTIEVLYNDSDIKLNFGGGFVKVNSFIANGIFQWNGININSLGQGTDGGGLVRVFMKYKNKLYVGGGFGEVDNTSGTARLAIWDGTSWSGCPIGEPHGGDVYDMTIYHDTLFMCGMFWFFGSTSNVFQGIIATDGTGWYNVGAIPYVWVSSLITFNDRLYLGGYYGMKEYKGGTTWEQLTDGPESFVNDMDVDTFNNFLYVGGSFFNTGSMNTNSAAMFDGFEWHSMSNDLYGDVYEQGVKCYHGEVYYGGDFDTLLNGKRVHYIAKWDGTQWDSICCNLNNVVFSLEVFKDTLFIGGAFNNSGGTPADGVVKYYRPITGCNYLQPLILAVSDTFKINTLQPTVDVQFYNNNAYADSWAWDFDDGSASAITKDASHVFDTPGTYHVSVTVSHNACVKMATRDIVIINNTGLESYTRESLQFKVFPNPTSGSVTVQCTLPNDKTGELRTHNINGTWNDVYPLQPGLNRIEIPSSGLHSGVNLMSLFVDGDFVFSEKVVKE